MQVTPGQNLAKDQVPYCYFLQIFFPLKTFSSVPTISISLYVTRKIKIYVQLICNWRRIIFQILFFFGSAPISLGTHRWAVSNTRSWNDLICLVSINRRHYIHWIWVKLYSILCNKLSKITNSETRTSLANCLWGEK